MKETKTDNMDQYVCTECGGTIIHEDKVCPHCGSDTSEIIDCPKADAQQEAEPQGIAGWLIIPAIGLVLAPIMAAAGLFLGLSAIQSYAPERSSDPRLWLWALIQVSMIVAAVIVAVLFFKRRQLAVRGIIGLMLAAVVANLALNALNASMFASMGLNIKADPSPVIRTCVFGAIWIPYFLKSKRVKNTFTEVANASLVAED